MAIMTLSHDSDDLPGLGQSSHPQSRLLGASVTHACVPVAGPRELEGCKSQNLRSQSLPLLPSGYVVGYSKAE